jgi:hypothetical protein
LEARRQLVDGELGAVPGLVIAAQAFLYSVGLNPNVPRADRALVLAVGLAPLLVCWQMLAKKRFLEEMYSEAIADCRTVLGLPDLRRIERHHRYGSLVSEPQHELVSRRMWLYGALVVKRKTHRLWQGVFATFAVVDVVLLVLTLTGVSA